MPTGDKPLTIRPDEEKRIRQAVRMAVSSCRLCGDGSDCLGSMIDLFKYLPPEVKHIVEDEQAHALQMMVGGD
jgi:hypothetical protein